MTIVNTATSSIRTWSLRLFARCAVAALIAMALSTADVLAAAPDACTLIKPPTTPIELMENLKCAVAQNIFSDDDFFTNDKKLWELFAGQQFYKRFPTNTQREDIGITIFPPSIDQPHYHIEKYAYPLNIEILRAFIPKRNRFETRVTLSCTSGLQLTYDNIVKIFGSDWTPHDESKTIWEPRHPSMPAPAPKSSVHGYQKIDYTLNTQPGFQATVTASFDHAGIFDRFEITLSQK